jgi:hypothetical protein
MTNLNMTQINRSKILHKRLRKTRSQCSERGVDLRSRSSTDIASGHRNDKRNSS